MKLIEKSVPYFITHALGNYRQEMAAMSSKEEMLRLDAHIIKGINFYRDTTRKIPRDQRPGMEHAAIDAVLSAFSPETEKASCRVGCAHCCNTTVLVTNSEARQLAKLVKSGEVDIDHKLLKEQAAFEGDNMAWWMLPKEKNRCVFLGEDNRCKVYDKRPTSCRKYLVRSEPIICSGVGDTSRPDVLTILPLEIMASGFADLDRNEDNLPKSVLREMEDL